MKVILLDVDSTIPNLALMQISAWHKARGDEVLLDAVEPADRVYLSCIFTKNRSKALGQATLYPDAEVLIGGSGVNYSWLPDEMQKIRPDYDLYPGMDYSLGFTTRGCFRSCSFCIVPEKEGPLHRWQHPRDFHDPRFTKIRLLDNNLLADRERFFEVTSWINDRGLAWDVTQGLDVRLLDEEIARRLVETRTWRRYRFAFDHVRDEPGVRRGIALLQDAGANLRRNVQFYVLVGYDSTEEEDKYRCRLLKELGTNPFVMKYRSTPWTNKIARWANFKKAFWSVDIDDYTRVGERARKREAKT